MEFHVDDVFKRPPDGFHLQDLRFQVGMIEHFLVGDCSVKWLRDIGLSPPFTRTKCLKIVASFLIKEQRKLDVLLSEVAGWREVVQRTW